MTDKPKTPWRIALKGELPIWLHVTLLWAYLAVRDQSAGLGVAALGGLLCVLLELNATLHRRRDTTVEHKSCGCALCKAVGDA